MPALGLEWMPINNGKSASLEPSFPNDVGLVSAEGAHRGDVITCVRGHDGKVRAFLDFLVDALQTAR